MDFNNFAELADLVRQMPQKSKIAVAAAEDEHTLQAIAAAVNEGIADAVLIGDETRIGEILAKLGENREEYEIIRAGDVDECLETAIGLIHEGRANALMKGKMGTAEIMRAVFKKDNGLIKGGLVSLVGIYDCPNYHKLFAVSDVAINTHPDLDGKKAILENAVDLLHSLGVENPKVGVLCAVETVSPKMQETLDANALKEMNQKGEITGCIVEGPISFDLAMVPEAAAIKGFDSPVAGDADLLIAPDLCCGNTLVKAMTELGGTSVAGTIVGARVPIILLSRSASAQDKLNGIALAAYAGRNI